MGVGVERLRAGGGDDRAADGRTFGATLGWTVLGAVIPGSGFWVAGRRVLGAIVFLVALSAVVAAVLLGLLNPHAYIHAAVKPTTLLELSIAFIIAAVAWVVVIVASHLLVRPGQLSGLQRGIGFAVVLVLCFAVAAPLAVGARYAYTQRDLIQHIFKAAPNSYQQGGGGHVPSADNPWQGEPWVNVLLLGGDGGVYRMGVRTDSMILASINTTTGRTVLFSVPRNLMNAPFPKNTPLYNYYPNGFNGPGDPGNWMLNAIYRMVPLEHPGALGKTDNEGADALKLSIGEMLGVHVDYYVLINLTGFQKLIDALGGITVNIDQIVPIGGNHDTGQPPTGWIQPGPNKHLDGWDALWFARGRWNTDDYNRMERQRCVIDAIIKQASPRTVLLRYEQIAAASKNIARTDIPRDMLPALVDLALKVKDAPVRSVVFQPNAHFNPADPNFTYMRSVVQKALNPPPGQHHHPKIIQSPTNVCAYHPVG